LAAAGTAITVATATASATSSALSRPAAELSAGGCGTRRVRRVAGGWGMYVSPGRTRVDPGHGPLNKVILAEDPDVIVSVYGREIIAPGLEKSGK
jgi:hypothetical protein